MKKKGKKTVILMDEVVETPLLKALFDEKLPDVAWAEHITDAQPVDLTPPSNLPAPIPLRRSDATAFEDADIERFTRMANAWSHSRTPSTQRRRTKGYLNYRRTYNPRNFRRNYGGYTRYKRAWSPRYTRYSRKRTYGGKYRRYY